MLNIEYSGQFKKDIKLLKKQGKNLDKLKHLLNLIINQEVLPKKYCDHLLKGNFKNFRDAHIEPNWLILYKLDLQKNLVRFERTGIHSELFKS